MFRSGPILFSAFLFALTGCTLSTPVATFAQTTPMTEPKPAPTTGKEIILTGIAREAKAGAVLVTDSLTYYIQDKPDWSKEGFLNKKIRVSGIPSMKENKEPLKNEKGEYSAGLEGKIYYLHMIWCEPVE